MHGALSDNTTGNYNTAIGVRRSFYNRTRQPATRPLVLLRSFTTPPDSYNTATGYYALLTQHHRNVSNTANGANALYSNTTASSTRPTVLMRSIATPPAAATRPTVSVRSLSNTIGQQHNTAHTVLARRSTSSNTTGGSNTANGVGALYNNTTGSNNTANGYQALVINTGANNIGLGYNAGSSLTTGSGNVCIGSGILGLLARATPPGSKMFTPRPRLPGQFTSMLDNKIGTLVSSRRFKDEIKPMDKASEAILALKPVTFRYKKEIEPNGGIMFGLIAEQVEKVDPELVTRNDKGEAETVRYEAVNAMLLNEFLKEHDTVQELKSTVLGQQSIMAQQRQSFEAQTCGTGKANQGADGRC